MPTPSKNNDRTPRVVFSLQSRMILFFGLMFAVTLLIINGVRIYGLPVTGLEGEYKQRQAEIFSNLNLITDLKEASLENWLQERVNDTNILARSRMLRHTVTAIYLSGLQNLLQKQQANKNLEIGIPESLQQSHFYQALQEDLSLFKNAYAAYSSIQLVDVTTGLVLVSTDNKEINTKISNSLFSEIKQNANNEFLIGVKTPEQSNTNSNHLDLFIARYVKSMENQENLALLVINVQHKALASILRTDQVFGESGEAFLITRHFDLLSATRKQNAPIVAADQPLLGPLSTQLQHFVTEEQPALLTGIDQYGEEVLAVYRPVPTGTGWGLIVKADKAEFFAALRQSMLNAFAIGTILSIFLGLGGTFLLARALSSPLESLAQTIQQVQEGDIEARAHVTTRDEVGMLASMFNAMLEQVQRSREELEQLVEARTSELRTANFSLEMTLDEMKDLNDDLAKEVSERKKAEALIRQKQREQQIIFDSVPAFIWYKDTQNNVLWMNRPASELMNIEEKQNKNTLSLYEILDHKAAEQAYQEDREVIEMGQPKLGILKKLYGRDHNLVLMQADKVPFIDEHGELVGVIVLATDITARIHAEEALRENEKRFRTIVDTAVDGIIMIDTQGVIQLGNPALARMFGYDSMDDLLGKAVNILMPSPYREQHDLYIENYLETGQKSIIGAGREIVGKRRDNSTFPIYLAVNELEIEGRKMFTGIISDITELKRTQQDLQRSKHELEYQNKAYSRFVPREFLSFLGKESIVDVELGDQVQKEMTIMFSDIRDFTALSESMTPEDNFRFINAYLSKMEPAILERHGFIDKYIGDAIMALFPEGPDDAVQAAIGMLHKLHQYNAERAQKGYLPIDIGIGIHTGSLMLGTIGGQKRMDGTVISDAVNLASRVEGLTKIYGASLLITEHTFNYLNDLDQYDIRFIDKVRVKGKSEPVIVFEVLNGCPPDVRKSKLAILNLFTDGFTAYQRRNFTEATDLFQQCLHISPHDKASQIYLKRCQFWERYGDDPTWNGITELESKESLKV